MYNRLTDGLTNFISSWLQANINAYLYDRKMEPVTRNTEMIDRKTLFCIFTILVLQSSVSTASECSDAAESKNLSYIRICEDGSVTSHKVVLDTHTARTTGETTCSCIVDSASVFQMSIQHYGIGLNPNTSGCCSEVVTNDISDLGERNFKCNSSPSFPFYIGPINITWRGGSGGDSKYCLNITGFLSDHSKILTITCSKPTTMATTDVTTTVTTTITTTTQNKVTSVEPTTAVNLQTHEPTTGADLHTETETQTTPRTETSSSRTKISATPYRCEQEGIIRLQVYAFVAILVLSFLVLLYSAIITFLYIRRYIFTKDQHGNVSTNGTTSNMPEEEGYVNVPLPDSSDREYEGLELSQVNLTTNTYEELRNEGTRSHSR